MPQQPSGMVRTSRQPPDELLNPSEMSWDDLVSLAHELGMEDALQNLRVRANQHLIPTQDSPSPMDQPPQTRQQPPEEQ